MAIIGVGIDIIEVTRLNKAIERYGSKFLTRVFTDDEIEYCKIKKHCNEHYAARFAAKEAFVKALGTGIAKGIRWKDIEIGNNKAGKPEIFLDGIAKEIADKSGVKKTHISMTHNKGSAIAFVILEG